MVSDAQSFGQQRVTEFCDLFFVEMQRHQGTVTFQHILEPHDFALDIEALDLNDIQRFVQDYFLPLTHRFSIDRRMHADFHLPSGHIDISSSVSIETGKDGVG